MKGKKIELKDITSSPYFVIGLMSLVCLLITGLMVFLIMNIDTTKKSIVDARAMYEQNVKEVALLEELKVKSEAAQEQLEACKDILPDSLGDVFILQEDVLKKCADFGLDVLSIDQSVAVNETQEVIFTINASGKYEHIYNFMNYYSNLERVHRFDALTLTRGADGTYNAMLTLAFLSEQGAEGAVAAVVDEAAKKTAS